MEVEGPNQGGNSEHVFLDVEGVSHANVLDQRYVVLLQAEKFCNYHRDMDILSHRGKEKNRRPMIEI